MPTTLAKIRAAGFDISAQTAAYADIRRILSYEIKWRARADQTSPPSFLAPLSCQAGIQSLEWKRLP